VLAFGEKWLGDTAVYHCQQAAEKSLKAYLALNGSQIQKIHDLTVLLSQCERYHAAFSQLLDACEILPPYGTLFRYPGTALTPKKSDVEEAVQLATEVYEFTVSHMPVEVQKEIVAGSGR